MRTKIIYEDEQVLVIHKPAGLPTETAKIGQPDVVSELKTYLGKDSYLGMVHRLDQPVEGLLVFAKTKEAAADLTSQLTSSTLNKTYLAEVCGHMKDKTGSLVDNLVKIKVNGVNIAKVCEKTNRMGKRAVLYYTVVERREKSDLLKVIIETGRFHQIRVQMSHAGHPLLGDRKYGNPESAKLSQELNIRNVRLIATDIEFTLPGTKEIKHFSI